MRTKIKHSFTCQPATSDEIKQAAAREHLSVAEYVLNAVRAYTAGAMTPTQQATPSADLSDIRRQVLEMATTLHTTAQAAQAEQAATAAELKTVLGGFGKALGVVTDQGTTLAATADKLNKNIGTLVGALN